MYKVKIRSEINYYHLLLKLYRAISRLLQTKPRYFVATTKCSNINNTESQRFNTTALSLTFPMLKPKRMSNLFANSIVFVTGAFISSNCWDEWVTYFESKGYKCTAPAWPHKDSSPEILRNKPSDSTIASNTIASVAEHFRLVIRMLPEKPILVGHSLGGLIVQLLLQEGLGSAGVAIHSFPPSGVNSFRFSFLMGIWKAMMLFTSTRKTYMISFRKWRKSIVNGKTYEEQKELYYQYAIPESKQIVRDIYSCTTNINFRKLHQPILFTSGRADKLVPASLNYWNYKQYADTNSNAGYTEFNNHNHLVFGQPEWKEEAECILCWLNDLK